MKKSIGIDLGTTNSVVAFKDTQVKILRNKENEELTRSCITSHKGEILVGKNAYRLLKTDPVNVILSIKRLMGGAIKDKMVQDMVNSSYYKYAITPLKRGTEDSVAVVLDGKQYTPEQISAEILKKLKLDAEERLGDEVTHAVITVPAYFTEKQKNATRVAAQLAGLKVQKLLAEPTAAAIAYGVDNLKLGDSTTVLIYDFGGGTFDLSIINIADGQYMETATGGDRWLGGDDIDKRIQEYVLQKVSEQYKISDIDSIIDNLPDRNRFLFNYQMRSQTEEAKIQLSSSNTARIYIDNLLEDENDEIIDIEIDLTRAEIEVIAKPFIERSIELIKELLNKVGYSIDMIDSILLVGGTTCMPLVKELIKQLLLDEFGAGKVKASEKPMLLIAEGAAILSHRLGDEYETPIGTEASISNISYSTNHNYYIEIKGNRGDKFDRIIEEQMPLPCNVLKNYKTSINNQKIVKIAIYADVEEGKKEKQTLGFFTIEDNLPVGSEIILDITLGENEVFNISAYPKNNKAKYTNIVLGRGVRDSKALEFISNQLEQIISGEYSVKQKDFFLNSVQKEIIKFQQIGADNQDSEKWDEIATNSFSAFEQAERIKDSVDEDELAKVFAVILIKEYSDLIGDETTKVLQKLIQESQNEEDPLKKIKSGQRLKEITDKYPVLITLFTLKIASQKAQKNNPTDGHKLLEMHDQIVNHFRQNRGDEASALLDEAIDLRDIYLKDGYNIGDIFLEKSK